MSRPEKIDRAVAPLTFGKADGDRWELIDPAKIATTCSARHVQSVLEDAALTVGQLVAGLRATVDNLQRVAGGLNPPDADASATIAGAVVALRWARGASRPPGKLVQLITWHLCAAELPDADVDVLLSWGDGTPGAVGAWMGDHWIGPEGERLDPQPVFWSETPTGPRVPARPADPA